MIYLIGKRNIIRIAATTNDYSLFNQPGSRIILSAEELW